MKREMVISAVVGFLLAWLLYLGADIAHERGQLWICDQVALENSVHPIRDCREVGKRWRGTR